MIRVIAFVLVAVFGGVASPAFAASPTNLAHAYELYNLGEFQAASATARTAGTSEGMALAARAQLAYLAYMDREAASFSTLEQCADLARQAIALDAANVEAHLQYVVALGYMGRVAGNLKAHFSGYATDARAHMDEALRIEPNSGWAHGLLGAWHMEIVRKGGRFLAGSMYGANLDEGLALYRRALELDPQNPVLHYEFGLALLAQDVGRFGQDAERQLIRSLELSAKNVFERLAQERASKLLAALRSGRREELAQVIVAQTEFPKSQKEKRGPGKSYGLR